MGKAFRRRPRPVTASLSGFALTGASGRLVHDALLFPGLDQISLGPLPLHGLYHCLGVRLASDKDLLQVPDTRLFNLQVGLQTVSL
jgi:hypothetical protein